MKAVDSKNYSKKLTLKSVLTHISNKPAIDFSQGQWWSNPEYNIANK